MPKSTPKSARRESPKCALPLPDLEQAKAAALNSLTSASSDPLNFAVVSKRFHRPLSTLASSIAWDPECSRFRQVCS